MLLFDEALVAAIASAIVLVIGAIVTGTVTIIKALREARADRVIVAEETKRSVDEAKKQVSDNTDDIRRDITVIAEGMAKIDHRFTGLEKKIDNHGRRIDALGRDNGTLLNMIVEVDKKVSKVPV